MIPERDAGLLGVTWPRISMFPDFTHNGSGGDNSNPLRLTVGRPSERIQDCCPRYIPSQNCCNPSFSDDSDSDCRVALHARHLRQFRRAQVLPSFLKKMVCLSKTSSYAHPLMNSKQFHPKSNEDTRERKFSIARHALKAE